MLSIFPNLLVYNFLGIAIIRIVVGCLGVYLGFKILSKKDEFAKFFNSINIPFNVFIPWFIFLLFILAGGMMIIGLYTQVACIVLAYLFLQAAVLDSYSHKLLNNSPLFYLGLVIISLAFLFVGPGTLAFDLPL